MHGLRQSALLIVAGLILVSAHGAFAEQDDAKIPTVVPTALSLNTAAGNLPMEVQGDLLMNRGSYAAAIDAYQKAWPRSAVLWNKTGLAYHHLFALDEAMKDYQMALTLDPRYAEAYNNLGAIYHGKREFGLAERMYKRSLKYQPRAAVTYCNLGTTYFAESKHKQGVKAYRKAMQMDPQVFHLTQREQVQTASSRNERMAMSYNLAKLYASEGRNDDALEALHKALSDGFNDRKRLLNDREFAALRETPEFQKLMVEQHFN
jgi:tetratricopeptide (TPR) repeat protein